jgi:hypothetical protein
MDFLTNHYAHLVVRDTQNRGYISEDLNIVILALTFILYGMRMYSRFFISKSPGLDDAIITVGVVSGAQKGAEQCLTNGSRCLLQHSPSWRSNVRSAHSI